MKLLLLLGAGLLAAATAARAQDHGGHGSGQPASAASAASTAGYSAGERAEGLREGLGMGLAIPAETNGYPGPRHVLELADQIGLTAEQRSRTRILFERMRTEARRLGAQLLEQEAELDAIFREGRATPALLEGVARRIGETEAELKVTHLQAHLAMMDILSPSQVEDYVSLRRTGAGSGRTRPSPDDGSARTEHSH